MLQCACRYNVTVIQIAVKQFTHYIADSTKARCRPNGM